MNIVSLIIIIVSFVFICLTNSRVKKIYKMLKNEKKEEEQKKDKVD